MAYHLRILCLIISSIVFAVPLAAGERLSVFVSILPQKTFVQKVGGDRVEIGVMVRPGASPATYEPRPRQMMALADTDIYFSIGVPFERAWLPRIAATNPEMKVVRTDKGIEKLKMAAHHYHEDEHAHEHENEDEHGHKDEHVHEALSVQHQEGLDPHIWLSPQRVKQQVETILQALVREDPEHEAYYTDNYQRFAAEIEQLDNDLKQLFKEKAGGQFMVFHPSWGYLADDYGLKQMPIEIEGKNPKMAQLAELIEHAREAGIRAVFAQPQFSKESAEIIANEIGGEVIFADPLAEAWAANLREVAKILEKNLR